MKLSEQKRALSSAVEAAQAAGRLMKRNLRSAKKVNSESHYDIKLELDVRCQKLIEKMLHHAFPEIAFLGEEGNGGEAEAEYRWVVDPIDGTVNFTYEIPHCCVSIALQRKVQGSKFKVQSHPDAAYQTIVGVVYDPFCDELWTAIRGQPVRLNGKTIQVSKRNKLNVAIVCIGFGKTKESVEAGLPYMGELMRRVRKVRMMGSAALAMVYVASGRFDAFIEANIRLWDFAAGALILECAGGDFWHRPIEGEHAYQILASNGLLRRQLERLR